MSVNLFFTRLSLLLVCWWLLPTIAVIYWLCESDKEHRLPLRAGMRICFDVMREEWKA